MHYVAPVARDLCRSIANTSRNQIAQKWKRFQKKSLAQNAAATELRCRAATSWHNFFMNAMPRAVNRLMCIMNVMHLGW
jgi:hypothetical protein